MTTDGAGGGVQALLDFVVVIVVHSLLILKSCRFVRLRSSGCHGSDTRVGEGGGDTGGGGCTGFIRLSSSTSSTLIANTTFGLTRCIYIYTYSRAHTSGPMNVALAVRMMSSLPLSPYTKIKICTHTHTHI